LKHEHLTKEGAAAAARRGGDGLGVDAVEQGAGAGGVREARSGGLGFAGADAAVSGILGSARPVLLLGRRLDRCQSYAYITCI